VFKDYFLSLKKRGGFGKVDLLVSLAVAAILGVMALPMISDVIKKHDREIICQRNLKEIGISLIIYSRDNNGYFPASNNLYSKGLNELYPDRFSELDKLKCPNHGYYTISLDGKLRFGDGSDEIPIMWDSGTENHRHGGNVLYGSGGVICVDGKYWREGRPPEYSARLENE